MEIVYNAERSEPIDFSAFPLSIFFLYLLARIIQRHKECCNEMGGWRELGKLKGVKRRAKLKVEEGLLKHVESTCHNDYIFIFIQYSEASHNFI